MSFNGPAGAIDLLDGRGPLPEPGVDPNEAMIERLALSRGVMMVVGVVDTGKTTLLAKIARAALARGSTVAIVDCDIGQSTMGPPCAIGLSFFRSDPGEFRIRRPDALAFVGSAQPVGFFLELVGGACEMVDRARLSGADLILVDTTGLIPTLAGTRLKQEKLLRIRPDHLVLLEKGRELHPLAQLARALDSCVVHRVAPSPRAHVKPAALRRGYRKERFEDYFNRCREQTLELAGVAVAGVAVLTGRSLSKAAQVRVAEFLRVPVLRAELSANRLIIVTVRQPPAEGITMLEQRFPNLKVQVHGARILDGLLVGLHDGGGQLMDLAIVQAFDFTALRAAIISPFTHMADVRLVRFGCLRIRPDGTELAQLKPGEI